MKPHPILNSPFLTLATLAAFLALAYASQHEHGYSAHDRAAMDALVAKVTHKTLPGKPYTKKEEDAIYTVTHLTQIWNVPFNQIDKEVVLWRAK